MIRPFSEDYICILLPVAMKKSYDYQYSRCKQLCQKKYCLLSNIIYIVID
jgi:hypothetical protein